MPSSLSCFANFGYLTITSSNEPHNLDLNVVRTIPSCNKCVVKLDNSTSFFMKIHFDFMFLFILYFTIKRSYELKNSHLNFGYEY